MLGSCKRRDEFGASAGGVLPPLPTFAQGVIPRTTAPLKIDGEMREQDWSRRAQRHAFTDDHDEPARPFSEVRLLHDDRNLYVGLYAADENIQSNEFFEVQIGTLALHAEANGRVTPDTNGLRVAIDRDGTLDNASDDDEEWVFEIAIPLELAGFTPGAHQPLRFARCDTPKDGIERCGAWSGPSSLE